MKVLLTQLLILPLLMFSCNESEDNPSTPVEVVIAPEDPQEIQNILTNMNSKTWQMVSFDIQVYGSLSCRTDDSFTFNADGTYEYNGGDMLCGEEDNEKLKSGTWRLESDLNQIIFDENTTNQATASYSEVSEGVLKLNGEWNMLQISGELEPSI